MTTTMTTLVPSSLLCPLCPPQRKRLPRLLPHPINHTKRQCTDRSTSQNDLRNTPEVLHCAYEYHTIVRTSPNNLEQPRTSLEHPWYSSTLFAIPSTHDLSSCESHTSHTILHDSLEIISNLLWTTFPCIGCCIIIIGPSYHPPASHKMCIKPRTMSYFAYLKDMRVFSIFSNSTKGTRGSSYGNIASFQSFDHSLLYLAPFRQLHPLHCSTHGDISFLGLFVISFIFSYMLCIIYNYNKQLESPIISSY
jgi:hypothetical protein